MLLSKSNLTVAKVASQSANDVGINCIRLNPDGSTVATNGKVVMAVGPVDTSKVHFPDVGTQVSPRNSGESIPLDMVEDVVRNLPKDKQMSLQHVAMTEPRDPRKVEFTTSDRRTAKRVEGMPKQEPFPNWKGIFKKLRGTSAPLRVCLNRKSLIELLTALESACPDKGGENPIFLEVSQDGSGMVLRCTNRETGQHSVGGITAYNTGGQWMLPDSWERTIFETQVKKLL